MMDACSEYSPSFAISDIDGYHILFYTNYLKFNHRAALQAFFPSKIESENERRRVPLSFDMHKVHSLKYLKPVKWGDKVTIQTSILGVESRQVSISNDDIRVTVYHEWTRRASEGESLETCNQAVIEYQLNVNMASTDFNAKIKTLEDTKALRRIEAFRKSNQADFTMPSGGLSPRRDRFTMYVDMAALEGRLSTSAIFDIVERARTNIVGGQGNVTAYNEIFHSHRDACVVIEVLRRMQDEKGLRIYASLLQDCTFNHDAKHVPLGSEVAVESWTTLTVNNHCGYVKQQVVLEDGVVAFTYYVKLFLFHEPSGKIVPFTGESLISMQTNSGFF